jgi:hypothetical protein
VPDDRYQVWCNGAAWSGSYRLQDALRRIGELAERTDVVASRRDEWHIRIVKIAKPRTVTEYVTPDA